MTSYCFPTASTATKTSGLGTAERATGQCYLVSFNSPFPDVVHTVFSVPCAMISPGAVLKFFLSLLFILYGNNMGLSCVLKVRGISCLAITSSTGESLFLLGLLFKFIVASCRAFCKGSPLWESSSFLSNPFHLSIFPAAVVLYAR